MLIISNNLIKSVYKNSVFRNPVADSDSMDGFGGLYGHRFALSTVR